MSYFYIWGAGVAQWRERSTPTNARGGGGGGGGYLGQFLLGMCRWPLIAPTPL